jgi:PIN domain nuclease of toxin-antitoxin system
MAEPIMRHVLDAHPLIWYLEANSRLPRRVVVLLADQSIKLVLPAIALAEAIWVVQRGRTRISSVTDLLRYVRSDSRIEVMPLTQRIVEWGATLTSIPEMHDRLIVATALALRAAGDQVVLVTKDGAITGSGLVPVIW